MVTTADWKRRIVELVVVKQRLAVVDTKGLWQYCLPKVAATESRLEAVEDHIGESLDSAYRAFLRHADGWPAFYQTVDLFGSDDLLAGAKAQHAAEMLSYVEDDVLAAGGLAREGLLPIAASPIDLDLFVMTRRSTAQAGGVVWRAGPEIDRFQTLTNTSSRWSTATGWKCSTGRAARDSRLDSERRAGPSSTAKIPQRLSRRASVRAMPAVADVASTLRPGRPAIASGHHASMCRSVLPRRPAEPPPITRR